MKINPEIFKKLSLYYFSIKSNKTFAKIKNLLKNRNYDETKDLYYNENLLKLLKVNIKKLKSNLNSFNFQYNDPQLSWHYHLFLGLRDYFGDKKINILEIGTFNGNFSNFISKVYSESQITTIDLDENDKKFINTYNRNEKEKLEEFLKLRNNNLNRENLEFIKLNSLNIKSYFNQKKFNLIWIDADHLNPQVTIDIINSLDLLTNDGIICTDDVIMDEKFKKGKYISNESFFTLKHLEYNGLIKSLYLIKRVTKNNSTLKKFISISTFKNNSKFIIDSLE